VKRAVSDLAIFGGEPLAAQPLHVGRPHIGDRYELQRRFDDLLDRRWLTNNGPYVLEFEAALARYLDVRHCVATCNGTAALQVLSRALALEGEVILPSLTFVATAHAFTWEGLTARFCDVHPVTHTIDPDAAEALVGDGTCAIVGVHLWGTACDVDRLTSLARSHGLKLIFDAAHAFGCTCGGRLAGGFGDAEVFSFHATKVLNAFEGGAIATNDGELADRARRLRNFGFSELEHVSLGINAKMSESSAAMGLTSLESMDLFVARNRANFDAYCDGLSGLPGVALRQPDVGGRSNFHHIVVTIDAARAGIARDTLYRVLRAEQVLVRRYFRPGVHRMEPYRSALADGPCALPVTDRLVETALSLPNGGGIMPTDVQAVCALVRFAVEHGREIDARVRRL
jgi:dTDP-4-amino-4,6-dideoxygalactose transaminase